MLDRLRRPLEPETYRRITIGALCFLVLIVVTGAGVRLTSSGLGCTDWPNCTNHHFVAQSNFHQRVEFVNRMITGLVSAAVALAVLGSFRRLPRRRDLVWLSLGLVAGVIAQALLGAVVVLTKLNPWTVQGHFVLSMLLVLDAVLLCHRAGLPDPPAERPVVTPALLAWGRAMIGLAAVVIITGTVVTGAGPHSGASSDYHHISRFPITAHDAARIHGLAMIAFLGTTVWVLVQLRRHGAPESLRSTGNHLLVVLVLQAGIGYTQYFTGVPPALVALHVFGACLVWVSVLWFALGMQTPLSAGPSVPPESPHAV